MRGSFALFVVMALAACGGGREEAARPRDMNTEPVIVAAPPPPTSPPQVIVIPKDLPLSPELRAKKALASLKPATSEDPVFTFEDENGTQSATFMLRPERGKGYSDLKLTLNARTIGDASPPHPVMPSCKAANRCEYQLGKQYAASLVDDKDVHLVARGDSVAVVARKLSVDEPRTVEIVLTVDNRPFSKRRVVLLAE